jgi:hypothetical protein
LVAKTLDLTDVWAEIVVADREGEGVDGEALLGGERAKKLECQLTETLRVELKGCLFRDDLRSVGDLLVGRV